MTDDTPRPPDVDPAAGPVDDRLGTFRADLPRAGRTRRNKSSRSKRGGRLLVWLGLGFGGLLLVLLAGGLSGYAYVHEHYLLDVPPTPPKEQLDAINRAPAIRFFDRNGTLIASRGPKYGDRVTLSQLPDYVPRAFLAAEDRRFYQHGAVDLWGIGRAALANYQAGHIVQGGSTLSQQLAKGLFLTPDQTLKRKVQEAVVAQRLETMLSKDEVLELYLNRTYFGANTFGLDAAARTYFGKAASQLNISEAALLAALPKAPSRMALTHNMAGALVRQRFILDNMAAEGWITAQQETDALHNPPQLGAKALADDGDMGYALDYATNEVLKLVPENSPDLMVRLTIDPVLQATGAKVLRSVVGSDGARAGASQGAMVALSFDGAIRTMVGGVDYNTSVFNRAVQARRQPGSSFKPFIYAAALEKGVLPSDTRIDGPVRFGDWAPQNYGGGYRGTVTVETALAHSINTVAVKLAKEVGGPAISQLAARFGITTIPADPNLSVALGAYEVPLIEMVTGFQVFQNQGQSLRPFIVDEIQTVDKTTVYLHQTASPLPAYDIVHASMMVRMMEKVITNGTGTRAAFGRPAAGKTGTSQNWRDAWFIGFTPDYVAGVWVGNDDDKPMNHITGGIVPAEIWRRFMMTAHADLPVRDFDWLVADPTPVLPFAPEPEPETPYIDDAPVPRIHRNGFYDDLSADFNAAAGGEKPTSQDPTPPEEPPIEPPLEPEAQR